MNRDLGFTPSVFGWGAGIFFVGYVLFEIPSNLIMHRVGARRWIARIMISWGLVAAAMMFVRGVASFYAMRMLLGLAEAGFFPGIILYLTYWYPDEMRGRAIALFMTAAVTAGVIGGPISGALLTLHGAGGLAGWQWLFLIEGLPAVVLGVVVWRYLPDRPESARWLTAAERAWLAERMARDRAATAHEPHERIGPTLASPAIWLLALVYFTIVIGLYGTGFWIPQIIQGLGTLSNLTVGDRKSVV